MKEKYQLHFMSALAWLIVLVMVVLAVGYCIFIGLMAWMMLDTPEEINLNNDTEALTMGEVWTEEEKFEVWIDDIVPISKKVAYEEYGFAENAEMNYVDISFSYRNIDFPGYKQEDKIISGELCLSALVSCVDQNGEQVSGWLSSRTEPWYETAELDGVEVPVTKGITSSNNHIIVKLNEDVAAIDISFQIPAKESYTIYRRSFLLPVSGYTK